MTVKKWDPNGDELPPIILNEDLTLLINTIGLDTPQEERVVNAMARVMEAIIATRDVAAAWSPDGFYKQPEPAERGYERRASATSAKSDSPDTGSAND